MRPGALIESLPGPRWRQKALICPARAEKAGIDRLVIGFINIYDSAVGDVWSIRPACPRPILEKFPVTRRSIGSRVDKKIARVDRILSAKFKRLRITAHHPYRRIWML